MTTKEIAKKWGCNASKVANWCKEGLIPLAEKVGRRWDVPHDSEMPPCTVKQARFCIMLLMDTPSDLDSKLILKYKEVYAYLSRWGFISKLDMDSNKLYLKSMAMVKVRQIGKEFCVGKFTNKKMKKSAGLGISASCGLGINASISTEKEGY